MVNLRKRVLSVTVWLLVGTVILCSAVVFALASVSLRSNLDNSILQLARTEIASATDTGVLHVHETGTRTLNVSGVPGYEKYVWIEDENGQSLAATNNISVSTKISGAQSYKAAALKGLTTFGDFEIDGKSVRAVFYPFTDLSGNKVVGIVGVPSEVTTAVVAQMGEVILIVGVLCIVFGVIAAILLSRTVTGPLGQLTAIVTAVDPASQSRPGFVEAPYEEVSMLVGAFNQLVGRVQLLIQEREATIDRQRQFVADTSHELRTPVSNLQGTLEVILRRERTAKEYKAAVVTSLGEVHRMSRLIQDLLVLAKTDAGDLDIRRTECDVIEILRDAVDILPKGSVEVRVLTVGSIEAVVDRDRIRQAVDNLLRNALTHASSRVEVDAQLDGDQLTICVSNDGPPINPQDIELIFERFHRLDHSRARDTGGSGLGLSIVRAIARGHGGEIAVESDVGRTAFLMRLPIR